MNAFSSDTNDKLDVITFHQLDILADLLIRETNSMHQEFLTKLEFVKDCIAQTVQNEQKVRNLSIENHPL